MTSNRPRRGLPDATVVTGAAGWFGTAFTAALVDPAHPAFRPGPVRVLLHDEGDRHRLPADDRVEVVVGNVAERAVVEQLFDGLSGTIDVVHAAGVIHPATISDFVETNTRGTHNVAVTARAAGVRRMVHLSSNSPFGTNADADDVFRNEEPYNPFLGYGRSKMLAELRLLDQVEAGLDAVIVRPPWFYGPHQPARQTTFFTMVRTGRFPLIGDGSQRRSMVYVGNLVDGVLAAELTPTDPGRGWWIADARPYRLDEIVATVKTALAEAGLEVARRQLRLPHLASRVAEAGDRLLQTGGRYNQQLHVLGELGHTIACDIGAARHELGYSPSVDLAEGMRHSIAWCLERGIEL